MRSVEAIGNVNNRKEQKHTLKSRMVGMKMYLSECGKKRDVKNRYTYV